MDFVGLMLGYPTITQPPYKICSSLLLLRSTSTLWTKSGQELLPISFYHKLVASSVQHSTWSGLSTQIKSKKRTSKFQKTLPIPKKALWEMFVILDVVFFPIIWKLCRLFVHKFQDFRKFTICLANCIGPRV